MRGAGKSGVQVAEQLRVKDVRLSFWCVLTGVPGNTDCERGLVSSLVPEVVGLAAQVLELGMGSEDCGFALVDGG